MGNRLENIVGWKQKVVRTAGAIVLPFVFGAYAKEAKADLPVQVVCDNSSPQFSPAIDDNFAVWSDYRFGAVKIYAKNIDTGQEYALSTSSAVQERPKISNKMVIWTDYRENKVNIFGFDFNTWQEFPVSTNGGELATYGGNSIDNQDIVWTSHGTDIKHKNLTTGVESILSSSSTAAQSNAVVSGDVVVFQSYRNYDEGDIYLKNFKTGVERALVQHPSAQIHPAVFGNIAVWEDNRNGPINIYDPDVNWDIYGCEFNPNTGGVLREFKVSDAEDKQRHPSIYGKIVTWQDRRSGNRWDLYAKNLVTQEEIPVRTQGVNKRYPFIHKDKIIFEEDSSGNMDIYLTKLPKSFTKTLVADLDNDGRVDFKDYSIFTKQWGMSEQNYSENTSSHGF